MEKIIFEDLPSTNTPINANNLNQLQNNIENEINGIIESGNNANGRWIKYADGTLICASHIIKTIENTSLWNGFYIGVIGGISFPLAFATIYSCNVDLYCYKNLWKMSGGIFDTTGISNMYTISPESFTEKVNIVVTAVGRWK